LQSCQQFGAYNFGTEANFGTLKIALKPEEGDLEDVRFKMCKYENLKCFGDFQKFLL